MTARSIDTFGWDTAFALKVSDVNRLLLSGARDRREFTFPQTAVQGQWSFAPWTVRDASGSQICLELRFAEAAVKRKDRTLPLAEVTCEVTCEMVLKPLNRSGDGRTTNVPTLRPRTSTKWALVEVVDDKKVLSLPERADLQKSLDEWFRTPEALGEFERQFAGIRIDTVIADDDLAWMKPRAIGFAGAVSPDGDRLFGVLAKTLHDDVTGCPYQLSPYGIPEGAHAGLAISAETFLSQLMLPALGHVFVPGSDDPAEHFSIHDRNKLRNTTRLDVPSRRRTAPSIRAPLRRISSTSLSRATSVTITIHDMTVPVDLGPIRDVATMHLRVRAPPRAAPDRAQRRSPARGAYAVRARAPYRDRLHTEEARSPDRRDLRGNCRSHTGRPSRPTLHNACSAIEA